MTCCKRCIGTVSRRCGCVDDFSTSPRHWIVVDKSRMHTAALLSGFARAFSTNLQCQNRSENRWFKAQHTRELDVVNPDPHNWHTNGWSPVCVRWWAVNSPLDTKADGHSEHWNDFSWLWRRTCCLMLVFWLNPRPQIGHRKGFSLLWTRRWSFNVEIIRKPENVQLVVWYEILEMNRTNFYRRCRICICLSYRLSAPPASQAGSTCVRSRYVFAGSFFGWKLCCKSRIGRFRRNTSSNSNVVWGTLSERKAHCSAHNNIESSRLRLHDWDLIFPCS